ncbi:MAG: hypothetical protein H7039_02370, partial [Bryobacteraceae bacterium]|nr:hypothetical protein [Bryobacteraceae bacterium]
MSSRTLRSTYPGVLLLLSSLVSGQDAPAPAPAPTAPTSPSPGTPGRQPGYPTDPGGRQQGRFPNEQDRNQFPEMQRTFFFSGKVMMDDGTPPPEPVQIERVCNGVARPEQWTDSKGRFSFQLGQNNAMLADASTSTGDGIFGGGGGGFPGRGGMGGAGGGRQITERDLIG